MIVFVFIAAHPFAARAAELSFDPQDLSIGLDGSFAVGINLSSDEMVNALEVKVAIPPSLRPLDVSNGNSVLTLLVEGPSFDEASRVLSFSGIIPNGFSGQDARLATITFEPVPGYEKAALSFLPDSRAYAREGVEVPLSGSPIALPVVAAKRNLSNVVPDADAPEPFDPVVVRNQLLYNGYPTLSFFVTDKGSGVASIAVRESVWNGWLSLGGWREAKSPYRLQDPWRVSTIEVRATDRAGNAYTAVLPPERSLIPVYIAALIFSIVLGFFMYVRMARRPH